MELRQLSAKEFAPLSKKWLAMLDGHADSVIKTEYTQLFNIIKATGCWGDIKSCYNKPIYNCVIDSEGKEWGVVEIVLSKNGSAIWVKMLDIHLSPEIEIEEDTEESTRKRLEVFRASLKGIFELTKNVGKAKKVKVFGRTDALIAFLRGMHDTFSVLATLGTFGEIKVSIEGRWLVFHTG